MTRLLLFLVLCPFVMRAQQENLKPIGSDLLPANYWNGQGWQSGVKTQYTYDGLDIRAKDLGQYIIASGDANATREYKAYIGSRQAGGWLIAGGLLTAGIGTPIMLSNRPGKDGRFITQQSLPCSSPGFYCIGNGMIEVPNTQRRRSYYTGSALLLGGAILAGIGWGLNLPGQHMRRAVQYYNRALRERGVSWRLTPYATGSVSGVGLVGRL